MLIGILAILAIVGVSVGVCYYFKKDSEYAKERKNTNTYCLYLYENEFSFDGLFTPFYNACKENGFFLSSEPNGNLAKFTNGSEAIIQIWNRAEVAALIKFRHQKDSSEPEFRESIKKIYAKTLEELCQTYRFSFATKIGNDYDSKLEDWEVIPKKTYM